MDQTGGVDGVFAVVAGVVMPLRDVDLAFVDERIELRCFILQARRGMARVAGIIDGFAGDDAPSLREGRGWGWHVSLRGVTNVMRVPRERDFVVRAATLMVKAQCVGSGEI